MSEFNLLPMYNVGLDEITNGIEIKKPQFCSKNCNSSKCKEHYKAMETKPEGLYICPYGFGTYVFKREDMDNIQVDKPIEQITEMFTCLRVAGRYEKKKLIPKIKDEPKDTYREIQYENLKVYAEAYISYHNNNILKEVQQNYINDILHDIRKFNRQIKVNSDRIFNKSQDTRRNRKYMPYIKSISELTWFITMRMNSYYITFDKDIMKKDIRSSYNMHKIVYKIKECFKEEAEKKNIQVRLKASRECKSIQAFDCIEILPYLLLDNAIKYSPRNDEISITIDERKNVQHIKFVSIGPFVEDNEIKKIFNQGYRGTNAIEHTSDGMGIGLYTAKTICDINNIKIKVTSDKEKIKFINNIKFSEFIVDIFIDL